MNHKHIFQRKSDSAQIALAFVELKGIHFDMEIGVLPREKDRKQRVTIDVEVGYPDSRTRIPDSEEGLQEGFDYSKIQECVRAAIEPKVCLIETLANRIADSILAVPGALTCSVKISKERVWSNVPTTSISIYREAR